MVTIEEPEESENPAASCVPSNSISIEVLNTIPNAIRDMLKHERRYTTITARKLLVPLADLPLTQVASLLTISKNYAGCLISKPELISCISHKGWLFNSTARLNHMCQKILSALL